jgi:hypothetical protein
MEYLDSTIPKNLHEYLADVSGWLLHVETRYQEFPQVIVDNLPTIIETWDNAMIGRKKQSFSDFKASFEKFLTLPPETTWAELRRLYVVELNKLDVRFKKFISRVQQDIAEN